MILDVGVLLSFEYNNFNSTMCKAIILCSHAHEAKKLLSTLLFMLMFMLISRATFNLFYYSYFDIVVASFAESKKRHGSISSRFNSKVGAIIFHSR